MFDERKFQASIERIRAKKSNPVTINGRAYPSTNDAALKIGCAPATIARAVKAKQGFFTVRDGRRFELGDL